jgi:hypothetical protein
MANEEHVTLLKQGVNTWDKWRKENPDVNPDRTGADLNGVNLNWVNLTRPNLSRVDLSGASLHRADLGGVNLTGANLTGANLNWAILAGADLFEADLSGTDLTGVNVVGALLTRANLTRADLSGANLRCADLSEADLTWAVLYETNFANVNLASVNGLNNCRHLGPSTIDHRTLQLSGSLPLSFLRGVGLPDNLINYLPSLLNQTIQFYSVFISYSHADKSFAQRLYNELQGHGIRCWLDEHQMLPGDDIFDRIDHGIRLWDKILLCCSETSLERSPWVDREIGKALQKEEALWKERGEKVLALIPLNIDGYFFQWNSGKASVLKERLAGDFTGWEHDNAKFEAEFEKVVRALRTDEGGREKPPNPRL